MSVLSVLARRFVAGETALDAARAVKRLNAEKLKATLDFLGEDVSDREQAEASAREIGGLFGLIAQQGLDANVSLKLTQLGLSFDPGLCRELLEQLAVEAESHGNFIRIDMEGSAWTQATLDLFYALQKKHANLGVVLQAMLRRSPEDAAELIRRGARVRLCKGAYKEPASIAYQDKAEVNRQYDLLAETLLKDGRHPAIATHDDARIEHAAAAAARLGRKKEDFELQMLYGLRRRKARALAQDGHQVRIYVPYGSHWLPYFSRRLRERKENWIFVLKSIWRD